MQSGSQIWLKSDWLTPVDSGFIDFNLEIYHQHFSTAIFVEKWTILNDQQINAKVKCYRSIEANRMCMHVTQITTVIKFEWKLCAQLEQHFLLVLWMDTFSNGQIITTNCICNSKRKTLHTTVKIILRRECDRQSRKERSSTWIIKR